MFYFQILPGKRTVTTGEMEDPVERLLDCDICRNQFTDESGDHLPRNLPCGHTLCDFCLRQLIDNGSELRCPMCRQSSNANAKRGAKRGAQSFLHNPFAVALRDEFRKRPKIAPVNAMCEEHSRPSRFYCSDKGCRQTICFQCSIEHHQGHQYEEFDQMLEAKQKELENVFGRGRVFLLQKRQCLQDNADAEKEQFMSSLKKNKEDAIKAIKESYKKQEKEYKKRFIVVTDNILDIEKDIDKLTETEEHVKSNSPDLPEILEILDEVKEMRDQSRDDCKISPRDVSAEVVNMDALLGLLSLSERTHPSNDEAAVTLASTSACHFQSILISIAVLIASVL